MMCRGAVGAASFRARVSAPHQHPCPLASCPLRPAVGPGPERQAAHWGRAHPRAVRGPVQPLPGHLYKVGARMCLRSKRRSLVLVKGVGRTGQCTGRHRSVHSRFQK